MANSAPAPSGGGHTSHAYLKSCCVEYFDSDNDKIPLVILPGNPSDIRDFAMIKPVLEAKFRVIILQYPGFGKSTFEVEGETGQGGVFYLFEVVLQFLEQLQLEKSMFMGISIGAYLACRIAIEYPDLVSKLLLVCPCGFSPPGMISKHHYTVMSGRFAPSSLTAAKSYMGHKEKPLVASMLERAASVHSTPLAKEVIRSIWKSMLQQETEMNDRVALIRCPIFLVFGKNDPIVSALKDGKIAKKAFNASDANFVVLEARHIPFAEVPEEFLRAVIPFLGDDLDLL